MNINTNISLGSPRFPVQPSSTEAAGARQSGWAANNAALSVTESSFGAVAPITDEIESDLNRNDDIGRMFQQAFSLPAPPIPPSIVEV